MYTVIVQIIRLLHASHLPCKPPLSSNGIDLQIYRYYGNNQDVICITFAAIHRIVAPLLLNTLVSAILCGDNISLGSETFKH